jgi:tetratricopeptide (TPR) repeat protein
VLTHLIASKAGQSLEPMHYATWVISLQAPGRIFAHMAGFFVPFGWPYYLDFPMRVSYYFTILSTGIVGVLALGIFAWKKRKAPSPALAGLIFATLALLPTSNLIPVGNTTWGIRYMIPASLGLAMAGGWLWIRLRENNRQRRLLLNGVAALWLLAATLTTWWGHYNWRNTASIMEKLSTVSDNPVWLLMTGREQFKSRQYEAALATSEKAIIAANAWQDFWDGNNQQLSDLGLSSLDSKTTEPYLVQALTNRVFALEQLGRVDEAWKTVQEGIAMDPNLAPLILRVADHFHEKYKISRSQADLSESERNYQKAAKSTPETAETAWANLGLLYVDAGHEDLAIKVWQQGLQLMPGSATMRHNLGIALKNKAAKTSGTITTLPQP